MESVGVFAPETEAEAQRRYEELVPTAKGVVREVARAMSFDTDEYSDRVTDDVIDTAHEALFASLLEVQVGTREEFQSWQADTEREVVELGHENVDNAVWHAPPFAETVVMATYQNEQDAAVDTLRRQVFGRLYKEILDSGDSQ